MQTSGIVVHNFAALLSGTLPLVAAHGHEAMSMGAAHHVAAEELSESREPNYFRHPEYAGWMYAHIALMILGWVFVLPPAIMLSIAHSRYRLPAQLLFHAINGLGVFAGFVYNHATPDLYVNNSHHPIGWVVTSFTIVWTLLSIASTLTARKQLQSDTARRPSLAQGIVRRTHLEHYIDSPQSDRFSSDSGNFSGESRANSTDSIFQKVHEPEEPLHEDDHDYQDEEHSFLGRKRVNRFVAHHAKHFSGAKASTAFRLIQVVLEKLLLILGFLSITSGFVVYGGIFRRREIFSGLAHYIKGAIFLWYGLLTLGRWMGAFTEFGWAWNIRPKYPLVARWKSRIPSAEFTEPPTFVLD